MKTTTTSVALLALFGLTVSVHGQGQVTFNNSSFTLISTSYNLQGPGTGSTSPALGGFVYALFAAPSTVITVSGVYDPNWTFTGAYATNTSAASGGRFFGGQPVLPSPYATGTSWNFLVRGWSTVIAGLDWSAAQSHVHFVWELGGPPGQPGELFGTSAIGTISVGGGINPIPSLFGTAPGLIPGFVLYSPVPEPSSLALVFFVSATVIASRRRKH